MAFDASTAKPVSSGFDPSTAKAVQATGGKTASERLGGSSGSAGDMLYAALHGLEDTATFGLGDRAAAGISSVVTGQPYSKTYQDIQDTAAATAGAAPVSAAAGDVAGLVTGGGAISGAAKAAEALPVVGKAAQVVNNTLTLRKGQTAANVTRSAAVGGGLSAADAAGHGASGDDILTAGAAGAVVGPVAGAVGAKVAKTLQGSSAKAMQLLASKIGESADTLQIAFDNFKSATGRVPTMAELVGLKSSGELRQLAGANPLIGEAAANAEAGAAAVRPTTLADSIDRVGGPVQDVNLLTTARKERMDTAMKPIRDVPVPVDNTHATMLGDRRVRAAVNGDPELRGRINDALETLADDPSATVGNLTVDDFDSVRKSLRGRQAAYANPNSNIHNPHIAAKIGELADQFGNVASQAAPDYGKALKQFGEDSDYIQGFKHGMKGKTIGEASEPSLIDALNSAHGKEGYASGSVSRLAGAAKDSEAGAVTTAKQLSEHTGTQDQLSEAVGATKANMLRQTGAAEATSAERLAQIAPSVPKPAEQPNIRQAAGAVASAAYHSPAGVMYHLSRVFGGSLKMSDAAQLKVSSMLLNPQQTQAGINALRRAGAKDKDLKRLALSISAAAGANTGEAISGGQ